MQCEEQKQGDSVTYMIKIVSKGNFNKTKRFFNKLLKIDYEQILDKYGRKGVNELQKYTPVDTGKTAESWGYKIQNENGRIVLSFTNSNVVDGVNIAIILQYGHGTGTGGYVEGVDYINPALKDIFDKIADEAWKEVTKR